MLDQNFCEALEHKVSEALAHLADKKLNGLWCDGILLSEPDSHYSQKFINDNRQTKLKAYVGYDGQTSYILILKFGPKALSRYARNLDILLSIPSTDLDNWFFIDVDSKTIEIQLD
ncbi:hypothetical protein [Niastella sp. OAS944]|uniref:hypothetical protein n=1 Tax=Niastella sp. OAS944 TaxID=2664089 RepID=UPI00348D2B01|nr:hypothetical protein [Chitinophagaceae bacterium OAS944]